MILAANWKMHHTMGEARAFVRELLATLPELREQGKPGVVVFPSFPHLATVAEEASGSRLKVGAQDCYVVNEGAFTGEVSPIQVRDAGGSCVLVGHSERRRKLGDSEELVARKLRASLDSGLRAFLCVGETEEERNSARSQAVVNAQLTSALEKASPLAQKDLVIAYEPVWAIGTGRNASVADAEEMAGVIRERLQRSLGAETGCEVPILYGGSVKPGLLAPYLESGHIQGALVGGASLEALSFAALYREMKEVRQ